MIFQTGQSSEEIATLCAVDNKSQQKVNILRDLTPDREGFVVSMYSNKEH